NQLFAGPRADHTLTVWSVATGKVHPGDLANQKHWINLTFTADSQHLGLIGSGAKLLHPSTGKTHWKATDVGYSRVVVSPDGKTLAASVTPGHSLQLWDLENNALRLTLPEANYRYYFHAFMPDGKTLVTSNGHNEIALWDVSSGQLRRTF